MSTYNHKFLSDAMHNLRPNGKWSILDGELSWNDLPGTKPTKEEIDSAVKQAESDWNNSEYQRLRQKEYPNFVEYLDGVVKGDTAQIQAYIDKCNAVKEKYPKPE
jgi:hypothetical protein